MIKLTDLLTEIKTKYTKTEGSEASDIKRDVEKFISKVSRIKNIPKDSEAIVRILYGGGTFSGRQYEIKIFIPLNGPRQLFYRFIIGYDSGRRSKIYKASAWSQIIGLDSMGYHDVNSEHGKDLGQTRLDYSVEDFTNKVSKSSNQKTWQKHYEGGIEYDSGIFKYLSDEMLKNTKGKIPENNDLTKEEIDDYVGEIAIGMGYIEEYGIEKNIKDFFNINKVSDESVYEIKHILARRDMLVKDASDEDNLEYIRPNEIKK